MAQVISKKGNAERLEQMPHREMKDMAVIYRFMMGESPCVCNLRSKRGEVICRKR